MERNVDKLKDDIRYRILVDMYGYELEGTIMSGKKIKETIPFDTSPHQSLEQFFEPVITEGVLDAMVEDIEMDLPISKVTLPLILDFLNDHCIIVQDKERESFINGMLDHHSEIEVAGIPFYMPSSDTYTDVEQAIVKHLLTYCKP